MCNLFGHTHAISALQRRFNAISRPLNWADDTRRTNFEPRREIRIRDTAAVIRTDGGSAQLSMLPWAWTGAHGKPVFNFRSDDRDFTRSDRVLIPADCFYEFTGTRSPKTRWRFDLAGDDLLMMAGVVRDGAFAILTCEPGPDMAPIHSRQVQVLPNTAAWTAWSEGAALPGPLPAGTLTVSEGDDRLL